MRGAGIVEDTEIILGTLRLAGIDAGNRAARYHGRWISAARADVGGYRPHVYDLKAVNPREKKIIDSRTPAELLAAIEEKGKEVGAALSKLKGLLGGV